MITEALKNNLTIAFDKGWGEEVLPELRAKYKNETKAVCDESKPTLNTTHAALLLNTPLQQFKKFLVSFGFVSKRNEASDECIANGYLVQEYRWYPSDPQTPVFKITRDGFINLGAMYVDYRKGGK